jgi:phosphohistidine swiveling domain-containing protein
MQFLRKRLQELGKGKEFEVYKGILSVNIGETVAFTEKKNFYQVAAKLAKNKDVYTLFQNESLQEISDKLKKYSREDAFFERHIKKYEWVNTEYVSGGWSREKWVGEFKTALTNVLLPDEQLKILLQGFENLNAERKKTIEELDPPKDVLHALRCLSELIAQRDWTKGYFTKALLSYNELLDEIAKRTGKTREDILFHSYHEIEAYFSDGTIIPQEEIADRKSNGYVILIKRGNFELVTGKKKIKKVIESEKISEPFEKLANITEFNGLGASRGFIRGKVRVLEDASKISELKEGEILVTYMTTIEFIPAFRKAAAIVTDEGGMSCHAAIVSREFKLPCVVGTKVATRVLETGDEIELDADNGKVKILSKYSSIQ